MSKPDPIQELADRLIAVMRKFTEATTGNEFFGYVLNDLAAGRYGWYHDTLLCYIDEDLLNRHGANAAIRAANMLGIQLEEQP